VSASGRERARRTITRRPSRLSQWLSMLFALLAVPPLYTPVGAAVALGTVGAVVLGTGLRWNSRAGVDYGLALQVAGVAAAGWEGVAPGLLLASTLLAVLAWEVGRYGLLVGEHLGREANTARIELTHAGTALAVGVAGTALPYGVFRASTGTSSVAALALLAAGAFALAAALR